MSKVLHKFTRKVPKWRPRVEPVKLDEATPAQLDALKVTPSNTKVSEYVLTLAHDVESLKVRSPLFNAIMYYKGGMSRTERKLSKSTEVTYKLLARGFHAELSPRDAAIYDFARKLSESPPQASADDLAALQKAGLRDDEILDLILSTSLFGWANRLMHVLGDPMQPDEDV